MGGLTLPPVRGLQHIQHLPRAGFLRCIALGSQETEKAMIIFRVASGRAGDVVQCVGLCERLEGNGWWAAVAGVCLICLPRTWGQYSDAGRGLFTFGRCASIRHSLALMQPPDFISVLFILVPGHREFVQCELPSAQLSAIYHYRLFTVLQPVLNSSAVHWPFPSLFELIFQLGFCETQYQMLS